VLDTPWPTWIYPVNAPLLGAMTLTFALGDDGFIPPSRHLCCGRSGQHAGRVPDGHAVHPATSRLFLASVGAAMACMLGAFIVAELTAQSWPIVVLAVAAVWSCRSSRNI
jgi:hypothetical protein